MKPADVLEHPSLVLTPEQRAHYFEKGHVTLPDYVPEAWLARLRAAMAEMLDQSRAVSRTDGVFILEEGHSADNPRLHRVTIPQDRHPVFWEFMRDPVMTDLAADVVGPDVKFHNAKLNVKSGQGSRGFKWHQDIQSWPHTDYSPVTIGVYIDGCTMAQGPLALVDGSQDGPLYSMYDKAGNYAVSIREEEAGFLETAPIQHSVGGPGTTLLINCRTVHGSAINRSASARPLLLSVYSSADSFPYTSPTIATTHMGDIVRGNPARFASFDTRPCEVPPDWRGQYRAPWTYQKEGEERATADY